MFRSLMSSWPLFFGLLLIMIGNGLLVFLLGVRASAAGFSTTVSGLMMGGYFIGFFGGSRYVPRILQDVGHIRTFGALSAIASAAVLVHIVSVNPALWTIMRLFTGFAYAGMYIVVESWLNDKSTNETRGQMLAIYMIITMAGLSAGQLLGGLDDGITNLLFLTASILVSVAVVPILITASQAPEFSEPESVSLRRLFQISPLALVGMGLQGFTASMIFGMGAIYATSIGMSNQQGSVFLASVTIANVIMQYPVGHLSDRFDRRLVILIVACISAVAAACASFVGISSYWGLVMLTALYGGFSMTIYSLCIAHANDYLSPSQMIGTASALITVNGIGAIFGPPVIAALMDLFGSFIFFAVMSGVHIGLGVFVLARMSLRSAVPAEAQGPFIAVPEQGTAVAVSLNPETAWSEPDPDTALTDDPLADNPYLDIAAPAKPSS
ncbi:MAG: MFS transporter [SAR116 cluster bacterium]|nr:MFS transporter [SAR116 cluster bacterium]